jgi:hypothetical protein
MFLDGWMGGWVDGWVGVKAVLRIAYSNQKPMKMLWLGIKANTKPKKEFFPQTGGLEWTQKLNPFKSFWQIPKNKKGQKRKYNICKPFTPMFRTVIKESTKICLGPLNRKHVAKSSSCAWLMHLVGADFNSRQKCPNCKLVLKMVMRM